MKSILLASASVVALAGAAAAEVEYGGWATLGYNDVEVGGTYWDAGLSVTLSQTLDNGLTAGASFSVTVFSDTIGSETHANWTGLELSLTSDNAGLYFGDTDTAAGVHWSAGSALDGAQGDAAGDTDFDTDTGDAVLRGEMTFGGVATAISYVTSGGSDLTELQVSAAMDLGGASVSVAYQDADHDGSDDTIDGQAMGLSVATSMGGADVNFGILQTDDNTATGVGISYPAGAVTLGAYFTSNSDYDDAWGVSADYDAGNGMTLGMTYDSDEYWEVTMGYAAGAVTVDAAFDSDDAWSLDMTYDMGNGLMLGAGTSDSNENYAMASYDLGGGASVLVSYADADEIDPDEDLQAGTTVELSFSF